MAFFLFFYFEPFDRFAQFELSKGKKKSDLLKQFEQERKKSLDRLRAFQLTPADLQRKGIHPTFGEVTLENLLATWVAHDMTHIAQIMAKQYQTNVGAEVAFFANFAIEVFYYVMNIFRITIC